VSAPQLPVFKSTATFEVLAGMQAVTLHEEQFVVGEFGEPKIRMA
jgi:hypothetical protein